MATDDAQVLVSGRAPAPANYTIPGNGQIRPKVIFAKYDGSAATGSYKPALKITSDGGATVGIFPTVETVTAGGSVNVSWFPGIEPDDDTAVTPGGGGTISSIISPLSTLTVTGGEGPTTSLDLPASGVVAGTYGDASNVAQIALDAEGRATAAASVPIAGGGAVTASDGWVPDSTETWTFASFAAGPPAVGTFTIPGDLRAKYTVGTRIKLSQTTLKFFVVTADPTFDGTNTTVTVSGGTDYTLANAAITSNAHSYVINPQGWPTWFTFAHGATGFTGAITTVVSEFALQGRILSIVLNINGTSNATTLTWTLPVPAASVLVIPTYITSNSTPALGRAATAAASSTVTASATISASGGFNGAGLKTQVMTGNINV